MKQEAVKKKKKIIESGKPLARHEKENRNREKTLITNPRQD